ncbi:MAG: MlaD family protein [Candidatus Omnitrophota bacterium]
MKKLDLEFKVGIFVAIGVAIFISMIFSIGSFKTFEQRYNIRVQFDFANGVQIAAPVRLAGVEVGEVKDIDIVFDAVKKKTFVQLDIFLSKKAVIEEDAEAFINTLGLIGEKYVEILPGTTGGKILKPGDILIGRESIPVEKLTEKGYEVVAGLGDTIKSLNKVIGDAETQEAFKATALDLRRLIASTNVVMDKVKAGEGTIGKLFMDDGLYNELGDFVKDLKAHPWKLLQKPRGQK